MKSDADIMREAKLEAMGMPPQDDQPRKSGHEKPQMATDEMVRLVEYFIRLFHVEYHPAGHGTLQETNAQMMLS